MRGLVAHVERQLLWAPRVWCFAIEADLLQQDGALRKPEVLGHFFDQIGFKSDGRLVLGAEPGDEQVEFFLIFPGQHGEAAG